jgi:divinyl chlorophyllide a 8-vinyl-reductase
MFFKAVGKEPKYSRLPVGIFDVAINALQWLADVFKSEQLENAAELGRIGKYYAVEDMVTTDPEEMFGTITLQEHFNRIAKEGQEYDPYTTM